MTNLHPNWGTALRVAAIFAVFFLAQWLDGPSDMQAEQDSAASLRDAIQQARNSHE